MNQVKVNRRGAERLRSGHPWVYSSDIADRGSAQPGDAVIAADERGRHLGVAHYSSTSQICLRLLSTHVEPIGPEFYRERIRAAAGYREQWVAGTNACRVIHSEADLLPGLIVDHYSGYLVVQLLDQGMDRARDAILAALKELFEPAGIVLRNDAAVRAKEDLPLHKEIVHGEAPGLVEIEMNGLRLHADLLEGQKTGIYLDQRENYVAAVRYAHGFALDVFTSTGGFALHLASKCERVEAVDSSESALRTARRNAEANALGNIDWREADAFDVLAGHASARRSFSTVVLDPPAFAKSRSNLDAALRGYKEINFRALRLLEPGGVLVTCSCSFHVSEADLLKVVAQAALDAGRTLRVLERRTQAQDHPILLTVPETHYLKCLIFQVVG